MYYVRWYDPRRARPLVRDFSTKRKGEEFRERLPWLSEAPKHYSETVGGGPIKTLTRPST
jgi:hypothetical protein